MVVGKYFGMNLLVAFVGIFVLLCSLHVSAVEPQFNLSGVEFSYSNWRTIQGNTLFNLYDDAPSADNKSNFRDNYIAATIWFKLTQVQNMELFMRFFRQQFGNESQYLGVKDNYRGTDLGGCYFYDNKVAVGACLKTQFQTLDSAHFINNQTGTRVDENETHLSFGTELVLRAPISKALYGTFTYEYTRTGQTDETWSAVSGWTLGVLLKLDEL